MIAGILLAAGQSQRMGRPKLVLPWRDGRPIIAHMVDLFKQSQVDPIIVVTGADREQIEACLVDLPAILAHNRDHASQGMIASVRVGLYALQESTCEAALVMPADLPSLQPRTLQALIEAYQQNEFPIVAPSFERRRGHPVLLSRFEWNAIMELPEDHSLRDFLNSRTDAIGHVVVDDPGILHDLDTPEDYERARADES